MDSQTVVGKNLMTLEFKIYFHLNSFPRCKSQINSSTLSNGSMYLISSFFFFTLYKNNQ